MDGFWGYCSLSVYDRSMWETNNMDYSNSESYSKSQKGQDLRDTIKICPRKLNQRLPLSMLAPFCEANSAMKRGPASLSGPTMHARPFGAVGLSASPTCTSVTH
jgi:hypothetical protein